MATSSAWEFPQFQRLPGEAQNAIWGFLMHNPRSFKIDAECGVVSLVGVSSSDFIEQPVAFSICSRSRQLSLETYTSIDGLYKWSELPGLHRLPGRYFLHSPCHSGTCRFLGLTPHLVQSRYRAITRKVFNFEADTFEIKQGQPTLGFDLWLEL